MTNPLQNSPVQLRPSQLDDEDTDAIREIQDTYLERVLEELDFIISQGPMQLQVVCSANPW